MCQTRCGYYPLVGTSKSPSPGVQFCSLVSSVSVTLGTIQPFADFFCLADRCAKDHSSAFLVKMKAMDTSSERENGGVHSFSRWKQDTVIGNIWTIGAGSNLSVESRIGFKIQHLECSLNHGRW